MKKKMWHMRSLPKEFCGGKWIDEVTLWEVRVMAEAEGYSMVRRKGCYPYVCPIKELYADRPSMPVLREKI